MEEPLELQLLSSAGNTRGLIEAVGLPPRAQAAERGLPRGIPAASLKRAVSRVRGAVGMGVFRGEYPRPH